MSRPGTVLTLFGLLLPAAAHARAQAPPPSDPLRQTPAGEFGEEVEVTEVFVDVLALDRKGRTVPGLTAEDFVVREDGEPVEVTSVTFYTTRYEDLGSAGAPTPREGGQTAPAELPAARYFILFFHDQRGGVTNESELTRRRLESARYARLWVRDEMQPSDWIAVVRFDQDLTVLSDFTQDQDKLEEAIEAAVLDQRTGAMRPSERRRTVASSAAPSLLAGLPDGFKLPEAATRIDDAVRLVAEACGHIVGRKNLLLFTLGFGNLDSAFRTGDARYYPPMEEALNANNVAVYPIDLAGPSVEAPQTAFLSQLADDTGGELFKTFNSYAEPFRGISSQNTGYYLVTFRSEHPAGASGYQQIEVDVKKKGVRVRARRGYRFGGD
jgi:VWFA-related protein